MFWQSMRFNDNANDNERVIMSHTGLRAGDRYSIIGWGTASRPVLRSTQPPIQWVKGKSKVVPVL